MIFDIGIIFAYFFSDLLAMTENSFEPDYAFSSKVFFSVDSTH